MDLTTAPNGSSAEEVGDQPASGAASGGNGGKDWGRKAGSAGEEAPR